jgi:hypothetical protein
MHMPIAPLERSTQFPKFHFGPTAAAKAPPVGSAGTLPSHIAFLAETNPDGMKAQLPGYSTYTNPQASSRDQEEALHADIKLVLHWISHGDVSSRVASDLEFLAGELITHAKDGKEAQTVEDLNNRDFLLPASDRKALIKARAKAVAHRENPGHADSSQARAQLSAPSLLGAGASELSPHGTNAKTMQDVQSAGPRVEKKSGQSNAVSIGHRISGLRHCNREALDAEVDAVFASIRRLGPRHENQKVYLLDKLCLALIRHAQGSGEARASDLDGIAAMLAKVDAALDATEPRVGSGTPDFVSMKKTTSAVLKSAPAIFRLVRAGPQQEADCLGAIQKVENSSLPTSQRIEMLCLLADITLAHVADAAVQDRLVAHLTQALDGAKLRPRHLLAQLADETRQAQDPGRKLPGPTERARQARLDKLAELHDHQRERVRSAEMMAFTASQLAYVTGVEAPDLEEACGHVVTSLKGETPQARLETLTALGNTLIARFQSDDTAVSFADRWAVQGALQDVVIPALADAGATREEAVQWSAWMQSSLLAEEVEQAEPAELATTVTAAVERLEQHGPGDFDALTQLARKLIDKIEPGRIDDFQRRKFVVDALQDSVLPAMERAAGQSNAPQQITTDIETARNWVAWAKAPAAPR